MVNKECPGGGITCRQTERKNRREREKLRRKMMLGLQELESWRQGDWSWNGPGME